MTENDGGFRQFGRPKSTTRSAVNTSKMQAIEKAEERLYFLKHSVWSDDQHLQQRYLREVLTALDPVRVEVFGGPSRQ